MTYRILWLVAAIVVVGGIALIAANRTSYREPYPAANRQQMMGPRSQLPREMPSVPNMMTPQTVAVNLVTLQNSGESGTATLTDLGNSKTLVVIDVTGEPSGADQPAHIHTGTVANMGDVKYPLKNVKDGRSETVLDIPLSQIMREVPLVINIHKSANEIATVVTAGDITSTGATGSKMTPEDSFPDNSSQGIITPRRGSQQQQPKLI